MGNVALRAVVILLLPLCLKAAILADMAVQAAIEHQGAGYTNFGVLRRTPVTDLLDLVIARESSRTLPMDQQVGLFLQERAHPEHVYLIGFKKGSWDCTPVVERATVTDAVLSCRGEKGMRLPNQKWIYDVHAKDLRAQIEYSPFAMSRVYLTSDSAVFLGFGRHQLVAVEYKSDNEPLFHLLSEKAAQVWIRKGRPVVGTDIEGHFVHSFEDTKQPSAPTPLLSKTTYDQFAAARPAHVKDGYVRGAEIQDEVGPWQREGERVWFGKTFYDGEGVTGVGDLGYYDRSARRFHMLGLPELANWSVSAISVTAEAVWLGLVNNDEYGGISGGLLRYDRASGAVLRFTSDEIVKSIVPISNELLAMTEFGIMRVTEKGVARFFVDQTSDERVRIVEAAR